MDHAAAPLLERVGADGLPLLITERFGATPVGRTSLVDAQSNVMGYETCNLIPTPIIVPPPILVLNQR
jgi:hypothetical protein